MRPSRVLMAVALAVSGAGARAMERPQADEALPTPPKGRAWALVWHDEFLVDYVRVYDLVEVNAPKTAGP